MIVGTAQEVSFLIDFLPAYLFPEGDRKIDTWAVAGVSLGGHSAWHCLKDGVYESATTALWFLFADVRSSHQRSSNYYWCADNW